MTVYYKDVPKVVGENEKAYFSLLEGIISATDELATLEIRRNPTSYYFRVAPSAPTYIKPVIECLNTLHNLMGIALNYSKSIKSSSAIQFSIPLTIS